MNNELLKEAAAAAEAEFPIRESYSAWERAVMRDMRRNYKEAYLAGVAKERERGDKWKESGQQWAKQLTIRLNEIHELKHQIRLLQARTIEKDGAVVAQLVKALEFANRSWGAFGVEFPEGKYVQHGVQKAVSDALKSYTESITTKTTPDE